MDIRFKWQTAFRIFLTRVNKFPWTFPRPPDEWHALIVPSKTLLRFRFSATKRSVPAVESCRRYFNAIRAFPIDRYDENWPHGFEDFSAMILDDTRPPLCSLILRSVHEALTISWTNHKLYDVMLWDAYYAVGIKSLFECTESSEFCYLNTSIIRVVGTSFSTPQVENIHWLVT